METYLTGKVIEPVVPFLIELLRQCKSKKYRAREAAHFILKVLAETHEFLDTNERKVNRYFIAERWNEAAKKIGPYSEEASDLCLKVYDLFKSKEDLSSEKLPSRMDFNIDGHSFRLMLAESRVTLVEPDGTEKLLFAKDNLLADVHVSKGHPAGKLMVKQIEGRNFKTDAIQSVVVPITGDARPKVVDMDGLQVVQPKPSSVLDSVKNNLRHGMNDSPIDLK